jgi:PPM family protein phosphatase
LIAARVREPEADMELEFGAQSDTGCVRENNEDSYRVASDLNLFVLSDGMGGLEFGEVASRLTVDTVLDYCRRSDGNNSVTWHGSPIGGVSEMTNRLASAIRAANQVVQIAAQRNARDRPMGATVVAVRFNGERMSVAHVGDSRAYRLRGEELEQLTRDHSFVAEEIRQGRMTAQEAESSKLHNVLIRALGVDPEVDVDVSEELVLEDDTVLLCSDGLTRELSDARIAEVLRDHEDAKEAAARLVFLARQAGGGDNITAIVVRPAARPVGALGRIGRLGKWIKESV